MIDMVKFERRVNLLKNGKQLLLKHLAYGEYIVSMNPQHNRLFHETVKGGSLSEDRISYMLMWDCGDWYLYDPPHSHPCDCCNGTGKIQEVAVMEQV